MSPSGDVLGVSGGRFGAAVLDPRTGRVLRQMEADEGDQPFYLSFSDDGRRMATVEFNRREAVVWDVATGKNLARVPLSTSGEASDLGADGSTVYTAGCDGALRHWDVDGGQRFLARVATAPQYDPGETYGSPAPGGRFVAYTGGDDVTFFDVQSGTVTATVPIGDGFRRKPGGAWHPDGLHFALASGDQIRVWDARNGRLTARARASGPDVSAIDYSADGNALVVGELSGRVTLLDQDLQPAVGRSGSTSLSATWPPGPTATGRSTHRLRQRIRVLVRRADHWALLDLESGRVVREGDLGFRGADLDFSPDGRHVAISGGPGALQVLDASTGKFAGPPASSVPEPTGSPTPQTAAGC